MRTIESQLCEAEKQILRERTMRFTSPVILEIGTYKGGGSTITFLESLLGKGKGKLFAVEASAAVFAEMVANVETVNRDFLKFLDAIHGFSQQIIPSLLRRIQSFDIVFLDGGNNPREQIEEFELLKDAIPIGGFLFSHDANLRKGLWLVPYLSALDNWRVTIHQASEEGLLEAEKIGTTPSPKSLRGARRVLRRRMLSPVELATLIFPSSFKGFFLKLLPLKIRRRIGEGRK